MSGDLNKREIRVKLGHYQGRGKAVAGERHGPKDKDVRLSAKGRGTEGAGGRGASRGVLLYGTPYSHDS